MMSLLAVLMGFQGKANFRNLSRYSAMHEKRFSRGYRRSFDFVAFNPGMLGHELPAETAYIDASFMGKVDLHRDRERFVHHGELDSGVSIYSQLVWAKVFKRQVKLVLLRREVAGKVGQALLFSTDLALEAGQIIAWYKARFQIEFLFRDGKQFTGLMDCQARCEEAIHTYINASLTALNLIKLEDRRRKASGLSRSPPGAVKNAMKTDGYAMCNFLIRA